MCRRRNNCAYFGYNFAALFIPAVLPFAEQKACTRRATDSVFIDTPEDTAHDFDWRKTCSGNAEKYAEEYEHPVWKQYIAEGVQGTHDGMDWLEFRDVFECLKKRYAHACRCV